MKRTSRSDLGRENKAASRGGGPFVLDGLADPLDLVGDNDVAGAEGRGQAFFDIGFEYVAVHRAIDDQGRGDPVVAQAGDEGCRFPMPMRNRDEEPFAFAGATTKPGHFCRCPGFVNEDKTFWIKPMLPCAPRYPGFGDVRPILLGCVRGFF